MVVAGRVVVVVGGRTIAGNGGVIRAGRVVEVLEVVLVAGSRVVLVLDVLVDVVLVLELLMVVGMGSSAHAPRMSSSASVRRVSAVIGRFGTNMNHSTITRIPCMIIP